MLLTINQIAEKLNLSVSYVRKSINQAQKAPDGFIKANLPVLNDQYSKHVNGYLLENVLPIFEGKRGRAGKRKDAPFHKEIKDSKHTHDFFALQILTKNAININKKHKNFPNYRKTEHVNYDEHQYKPTNTFKSLSKDFQKSTAWRELSHLTQTDYLSCHNHICNVKTSTGLFGDTELHKITVGTIRAYRDFRSEESKSRAKKELSYISRVFGWAYEYEKVKTNPAKGIKKPSTPPRQHYAEEKDYLFLLEVAKESGYWYMPYAMEIAYLCRMRLSEVTDLNDADELPEGLLIRRRKGSRDNITAWNDRLRDAWQGAKAKRDQIITDLKLPFPINPTDRPLFISERGGNRLVISSFKTAKDRIDKLAQKKALETGFNYVHFTFHDIKRKAISDTTGNKQEASGHKQASMLAIYDVKKAIVKPSSE